jgi:hypothetical protein
MLTNNNERLNIWLACKNPFDYEEFYAALESKGVQLMTAFAFTDKIGIITCAKAMFPEMDHAEAAKAFLDKYKDQVVMIPLPPMPNLEAMQIPGQFTPTGMAPRTGCCGGGAIR